jgi:hypothetical protein
MNAARAMIVNTLLSNSEWKNIGLSVMTTKGLNPSDIQFVLSEMSEHGYYSGRISWNGEPGIYLHNPTKVAKESLIYNEFFKKINAILI